MTPVLSPGAPFPMGATVDAYGVNFALFSAHCDRVVLCLYSYDGKEELARIDVDNCTDNVWHIRVDDLDHTLSYGYRVHGPFAPDEGHRFNPAKLLLDPYARGYTSVVTPHELQFGHSPDDPAVPDSRDSSNVMPKCIIAPTLEPLAPGPHIPREHMLVYETHIKGVTQRLESIDPDSRGCFAGLATPSMLAHLKKLGVTSVELLPVQAFCDEMTLTERGLRNYWGYNSIGFFAPDPRYGGRQAIHAFRAMVTRLHDAGIEVIVDVVYNHTAEGNEQGPTLSFRGIDNASYYRLDPGNPNWYQNISGCGNSLRTEHPRVMAMVLDSLRYWSEVLGVDGFRFDLAPSLGRDENGYRQDGALLQAIGQDPVLRTRKVIAEPWDVGINGYQLGNFPPGWSEWNDRYRDIVRRFWRGDKNTLADYATRLRGSADLFDHSGRNAFASLNFITSHDGYTLQDLVSFDEKHNLANGEKNRDGHSENLSQNHGAEGETDDPDVLRRREQSRRNMLLALFLSQGVPMLLSGDEFGQSQQGNNNAYCQDNEITWLDWTLCESNAGLMAFIAELARFRKSSSLLSSHAFLHTAQNQGALRMSATWLRPDGAEMSSSDWTPGSASGFCMLLEADSHDDEEGADGSCTLSQREIVAYLCNIGSSAVTFHFPSTTPSLRTVVKTWCTDASTPDDDLAANGVGLLQLPAMSSALLAMDSNLPDIEQ